MAVLVGGIDSAHPKLDDIQRDAEFTEEHMHHIERWFGKKAVQTATEWCVTMDGNLGRPYRAISGNGTWGSDAGDEAQLFGTADIPIAGMVRGDFDEIQIIANTSSTVYLFRVVWGTGTLAAAVGAGQYTETPYFRGNADNVRPIKRVSMPKVPVTIGGSPVAIWLQCQNASDNASVDFFVGVHGYTF